MWEQMGKTKNNKIVKKKKMCGFLFYLLYQSTINKYKGAKVNLVIRHDFSRVLINLFFNSVSERLEKNTHEIFSILKWKTESLIPPISLYMMRLINYSYELQSEKSRVWVLRSHFIWCDWFNYSYEL